MTMIPVFDVGNVLLRWDPRNLFRKIFADEDRMEWFLTHVCSPAWNEAQDHGRTFAEGVAEATARHPDFAAEIRAFDERWEEMIPGVIEESVAVLEGLRHSGVPTYAITNFSVEKFAVARRRFAFLDGFDGVIVSGAEGILKPDPAIFHLFCDRHGLEAKACVFIDDNPANVNGARSIGMRAIHFTRPSTLAADLAAAGVRFG